MGEDPELLKGLSKATKIVRKIVSKPWESLKEDVLVNIKERIEFKTEFNGADNQQEAPKKEEKEREIEMDELPKKRPNPYSVPSWAKGVELEFDFIYDVVDFNAYFKEMSEEMPGGGEDIDEDEDEEDEEDY